MERRNPTKDEAEIINDLIKKAARDSLKSCEISHNLLGVVLDGSINNSLFTGLVACELIEAVLMTESDNEVKSLITERLTMAFNKAMRQETGG